MNFIQIITIAFTFNLMTISLLGQTTFYSAKFFIDDEQAQDQYYKIRQDKDTIAIQEREEYFYQIQIYMHTLKL